jgi:hypothetical protein
MPNTPAVCPSASQIPTAYLWRQCIFIKLECLEEHRICHPYLVRLILIRACSLIGCRSLFDIVANAVEVLYDHNMTAELLNKPELCSRRLNSHLCLEDWKASLPSSWSLCSSIQLQSKTGEERDTLWPRALLSIHFHRAQLLVNRPIIIQALRDWLSVVDNTSQMVDPTISAVLQMDLSSAIELMGIVRELSKADNQILQRHGIWFTANYSGIALPSAKSSGLIL